MFNDLNHIFSSVADGVVVFDNDLRFVFINDAAETMLALSREAAIGHTPMELFQAEMLTEFVPRIRAAIGSGQAIQYDARSPLNDRWFENRIYPSPEGVTILFTDITPRRKAEEALRWREEGHRLLVSLNDAARSSRDAEEVMWAVVTRAGRHFQVSRCTYGEIDAAEEHVLVVRDYVDGAISIAGRHRIQAFGPELIADLRRGQTAAIPDLQTDPRTAGYTDAFAGIQARSLLCVPLVKDGKFVALFVFHHKEPREWTEHEGSLAEQIAERTWFLVENARAVASLRESRDVLSLAMRGGRMGAWSRNMVTDEVWWSRELEELFGLEPGGFEGPRAGAHHRPQSDRASRRPCFSAQ